MEFYFPEEFGEQLAFGAAAVTAFLGLMTMLAPGFGMKFLGMQARAAAGFSEVRSTIGGFYLGSGLAALLLAQPMVYLAFGAAFAAAVFGRILSLLADRSFGLQNFLALVVQAVLGGLPLGYVFGMF